MFNDKYGLTQAVLNGRKTMTRRIVTDKKLHYWKCSCPDMVIVRVPESQKIKADDDNTYFGIKDKISSEYYCDTITSPYKVGEVIAIAQSYQSLGMNPEIALNDRDGIGFYTKTKFAPGWKNKMFVRADLMPHHIRITDIKIERLQNISDEDCLKEGITRINDENNVFGHNGMYEYHPDGLYVYDTPKRAYADLIDRLIGKGTWESNPYVFVYEFELVD